jgi:hypothetical protein
MARQPEDAHGAEFTSSGSDELYRDSFVPVNTAVSVSKIVAESRQSPKLLDRVGTLIRGPYVAQWILVADCRPAKPNAHAQTLRPTRAPRHRAKGGAGLPRSSRLPAAGNGRHV